MITVSLNMSSMPNKITTASIYQPLNESPDDHALQQIRLLTIDHLPTEDVTDRSLIRCSLRTAVLGASEDSYQALSYVWGNAHDTETILVNGQKFQATKNLVQALLHVGYRGPTSSKRTALWVDAICINQNDIPERNTQVLVMGTIYRNACDVLCWLGHSDKWTAAGMEFVNRLSAALKSVPDPFDSGYSPFKDPSLGRLIGEMEGRGLLTLPIFSTAPYWERAWTTQEMALARSCVLIAGRGHCVLDHLDAIIDWVSKFVNRTDTGWKNSAGLTPFIRKFLRDLERSSDKGLPLLTAMALWKIQAAQLQAFHGSAHDLTINNLGLTLHKKATDPRDMIYSLAMMGPIGMKINYASQVQDVYIDFAARIVAKLSDISPLIEKAGLVNRESKLLLPTWVPDWSIDIKARYKYGTVHQNRSSVNRHLSSSGATSVTGSHLHLLGMKSDHIQEVMPKTQKIEANEDEIDEIAKVTRFWYKSASQTILEQILSEPPKSRTYPTGIPTLTAILRLLRARVEVNDEQWEPNVLRVLVPFIRCVASSAGMKGQLAYSWDNNSFRPGYQLPEKSQQGIAKEFLSRICDPLRNQPLDLNKVLADAHSLYDDDLFHDFMWATPFKGKSSPFITSRGYIGYSRVGIQAGDIICAVSVSSMPIVLRPVGNRHTFLSTCCVVGIMDGGLFEKESKSSLREFVIV